MVETSYCSYLKLSEEYPRLHSNCFIFSDSSPINITHTFFSSSSSSHQANQTLESNQKLYRSSVFFKQQMSLIPSFFGGRRSNIFDPFSLDLWDPFPISTNTPYSAPEISDFANAKIDWKETPESHVFKVDVPGIKKEEVKVEVEEGRILQISGERNREKEEKNDQWHRMERSSGKFIRRFRLPENAKTGEIKAAMENGVLTVTVPKEEEKKKPEVKAIDISG
ncbi:17.3 kDa class I heat shock protein-like [Solanum lycopersicum]|nr:17.3 kDa class I heat shock protein-like [Solanum lycopersicum]